MNNGKHLLDIYWSCQVYLKGPPQDTLWRGCYSNLKIFNTVVCVTGIRHVEACVRAVEHTCKD